MLSRRDFIRTSIGGGLGVTGIITGENDYREANANTQPDLTQISSRLTDLWGNTLLGLQVLEKDRTDDYGGIWCPADKAIHGRSGDAIYPFYYLAKKTGESRYTDAIDLLYKWMETRVSRPDGSWLNEPQTGSWQGTTVFSAIALAESLHHHEDLMSPAFRSRLRDRLKKAGDFIYSTFTIDYGNINYPISATYALALLGNILDITKYRERSSQLARQALKFFTPEGFLSGEGDPYYRTSPKGCLSVDLGYNVEESLPALVMYGRLTKDAEVLSTVERALNTHMEFMLPDGAWDNSWGTRNYKWTWWGSRTSDGCQPAYLLMADRNPVFYRVALQNTRLMETCTHEGLLCGGPHYHAHGIPTCVHHTFSHIKSLVAVLQSGITDRDKKLILPREKEYGIKMFKDIQTVLISSGKYRGTVTVYDREYKHSHNGHASGGALSLLWHEKAGAIIVAGMNEYQLIEAGNMQKDEDALSMPLTPRMQLRNGNRTYMNISCLDAEIEIDKHARTNIVKTRSRLVDADQQDPPRGRTECETEYSFSPGEIILRFTCKAEDAELILPIIGDNANMIDSHNVRIKTHNGAEIDITCDKPLTTGEKFFNYVPGFEAIPIRIPGSDIEVKLKVL